MNEYRTLTRRILSVYRTASPEHVQAGLGWYDAASGECERVGAYHGVSLTHAVVACAHLSARVRWLDNIVLLDRLLSGQSKPRWALNRSWELALASLCAEDPLDSFGTRARKTREFARAILGLRSAVVVDTWTARAAGIHEDSARTVAGYTAVADAFRRGARIAGLAPRDLQAICWVSVRGSAI